MEKDFSLRTITVLALLVVAFLFYALHMKPAQIRQECHDLFYSSRDNLTSEDERKLLNIVEINKVEREKYDNIYSECLHENGLAQ